MGKQKSGFTLVEVALFLAVTGLLLMGVMMGVRGSIFQQRYTDAVQSFAEFLRSAYAQTMNVENSVAEGGGRTEQAIYGKLVVFGENKDLNGKTNDRGAVYSYTVVGRVSDLGTANALETLKNLNVDVFTRDGSGRAEGFAGVVEEFLPRWGSRIQTTKEYPYVDFEGAILIVRHPRSGTVNTYFHDGTLEINGAIGTTTNILKGKLTNFKGGDNIDFCVNPEGESVSELRRDVRIIGNARNASGVEVLNQDDGENKCK